MTPPSPGNRADGPGKPTSFWAFNLRHEWMAGCAAALVLVGASALSLQLLRSRYLELQQADANRVLHHLQVHLNEAHRQLDTVAAQPPGRWERHAELMLSAYSDLYELGESLQVRRVLMAESRSRVFPGFSFAGSAISPYLKGRQAGTSPISRGLEDEMASVYVLRQAQGQRLLGRIRLSFIQRFLEDYTAFSGTPVLLVSRDGFVMLSGSEQLRIPSIDLQLAAARGGQLEPLQLADRSWIPVVSEERGLGARVVTLVPGDNLLLLRQVLLSSAGGVLVLTTLIFIWKNLQLRRQLFDPVSQFAEQIQVQELRLRQGIPALASAGDSGSGASARFGELAAIQGSFEQLLATIAERDRALLEARQREQRSEEAQRRQLQTKLHSSLVAAGIAHEINLPLSTIRLLCDQARSQLQQHPGQLDVESLVRALGQQSQQVSSVIEKMRMLLRNVQTEAHPTDLVTVLHGASLMVKPLLRRQRVQLVCRGVESEHAKMVSGDAVQLQMAVTNLLRNAIEAAAERPEGHRRVRLGLCAEDGAHVVEVADSGPGFAVIPGDEMVLESSKPSGTGLGLFVVRTTVANHRGQLRFGRDPDLGGARVGLHLPALAAARP